MSLNTSNKIGILGGTFDPIHMGHLFLGETAYDAAGLDKVLIMPSPDPYHRNDKKVLPAEDRVAMVKLAIADNPHFEFSDFELKMEGPIYTARTLRAIKELYPDSEIYFILGGDSLFSIETWKEPQEVFNNAVILSAKRENESEGASGSCSPTDRIIDLDSDGVDDMSLVTELEDEFNLQAEYLRRKYNGRIINIGVPNIEISSSNIVKRIKEGHSVKYYLPDTVYDYIKEHHLYI